LHTAGARTNAAVDKAVMKKLLLRKAAARDSPKTDATPAASRTSDIWAFPNPTPSRSLRINDKIKRTIIAPVAVRRTDPISTDAL
jgi:hypothetical protein